jgi:hypothetical protein
VPGYKASIRARESIAISVSFANYLTIHRVQKYVTDSSIDIAISILIILAHDGVIISPAAIENRAAIACGIAAVDEIQSVNSS